jgi:hypothetical protein
VRLWRLTRVMSSRWFQGFLCHLHVSCNNRGAGAGCNIISALRPCALTEEPAGAPLEIDQGDVIKVGTGFKGFVSLACCYVTNAGAG